MMFECSNTLFHSGKFKCDNRVLLYWLIKSADSISIVIIQWSKIDTTNSMNETCFDGLNDNRVSAVC